MQTNASYGHSQEIAEATHGFQNELLSRPIHRRYVELTNQQNANEKVE